MNFMGMKIYDMNSDQEELFLAVFSGELDKFKTIAKKSPTTMNGMNWKKWKLLHYAVRYCRVNVIEWVLSDEGRALGFNNIFARNEGNATALHFAADNACLQCFMAIVRGCKVENGERKKMLNAVEEQGHTVLHNAATKGNPAIIKWLLSDKKGGGREAGFNSVLALTKEGITALHEAAIQPNLECLVAILEGCKAENGERKEEMLNAVDFFGNTVLHFAAEYGNPSTIKWLLTKGRDLGFTSILTKTTNRKMTALHYAAEKGHLEAYKAILEGCKVENGEREQMLNEVDARGCNPLHLAAREGHLEMCKAIVAELKVENGERERILNAVTDDGYTALLAAAMGEHTSVVNWLLSDKPGGGRTLGFNNVLARTKVGSLNALMIATANYDLEMCKSIVRGCRVANGEREKMLNNVTEFGSNILHCTANRGLTDIVAWLLSKNPDGGRTNGLKSESITALGNESLSALHLAAGSGCVETLRALLTGCTAGERLKMFLSVDKRGWTPLHYAARFHRVDIICELLLHHEETKMIVDHRDHRGMTTLHRVILDGGVDEDSKKEWEIKKRDPSKDPEDSEDDEDDEGDEDFEAPEDPFRAPREEVVEALLTYEFDEKEEGGGKAPSKKKGNKKQERKQQQQQHRRQEQQAAFINVNLGLTLEQQHQEEQK